MAVTDALINECGNQINVTIDTSIVCIGIDEGDVDRFEKFIDSLAQAPTHLLGIRYYGDFEEQVRIQIDDDYLIDAFHNPTKYVCPGYLYIPVEVERKPELAITIKSSRQRKNAVVTVPEHIDRVSISDSRDSCFMWSVRLEDIVYVPELDCVKE